MSRRTSRGNSRKSPRLEPTHTTGRSATTIIHIYVYTYNPSSIRLARRTEPALSEVEGSVRPTRASLILALDMCADSQKTFYLETFGCQMNVHDSEKVIGTLVHEGYRQVQTVEQADLILYNTCSIRDKAEQKVFNRLNDYKKLLKQGKKFGVLGCVAQQEGEKIFERAPHVSLVCGSASYRNLPQMLVQIEAGKQRVTGLDDRETDECFETEFTARTNPHRGYITIIEGCDKRSEERRVGKECRSRW